MLVCWITYEPLKMGGNMPRNCKQSFLNSSYNVTGQSLELMLKVHTSHLDFFILNPLWLCPNTCRPDCILENNSNLWVSHRCVGGCELFTPLQMRGVWILQMSRLSQFHSLSVWHLTTCLLCHLLIFSPYHYFSRVSAVKHISAKFEKAAPSSIPDFAHWWRR